MFCKRSHLVQTIFIHQCYRKLLSSLQCPSDIPYEISKIIDCITDLNESMTYSAIFFFFFIPLPPRKSNEISVTSWTAKMYMEVYHIRDQVIHRLLIRR